MINLYQDLKNYRPAFSRQLICKDLLFTQYDCPQTERKAKFYIECNLILYVLSGRRIFHKNNKTWDLSEGVGVFIKKGTHISEREGSDGWCVMAFFIPDNFLKQLVIENTKKLRLINLPETPADHILRLHINELSRSFFFSMLPYFNLTSPPPENLLELKFKELVLSLLSDENKNFLSHLHNLINDNSPSIENVMQNNFTFNLTLTEYATLACKSVPTFKREFKKIFEDSPAKWIMKKRLKLASELLENTSLSVGEITFECGFENQTHFSRIFKEKMGISPLQFRQKTQAALKSS